jgi:hypothetical protein
MPSIIKASNLHKPRMQGQGYTGIDNVIELINSRSFQSLESYLENLELGDSEAEALEKISEDDRRKVQKTKLKITKWITKWSNYIDDRIRAKYNVPFPDHPYAPEALSLACSYYVVHALYTYEGGHIGNREDDGEPTYHDYAEKIILGIMEGRTHLETEYTLPIKDINGNLIGTENISIGISGDIMAQHYTENPMSMANQDQEFGYAVHSRFGGSGYRQIGVAGGFDYDRREDYD